MARHAAVARGHTVPSLMSSRTGLCGRGLWFVGENAEEKSMGSLPRTVDRSDERNVGKAVALFNNSGVVANAMHVDLTRRRAGRAPPAHGLIALHVRRRAVEDREDS